MAMALLNHARHHGRGHIGVRIVVASLALVVCSFAVSPEAGATRLKDLINIKGVRGNSLQGFGIVSGLTGTGDSKGTGFSNQALANL